MNKRKVLKGFGYALAGTAVVSALLWAGTNSMANHRYKALNARWKQLTGEGLEGFLEARPATKTNDTAKAFEAMGAKLGLHSVTGNVPLVDIKSALSNYLSHELEKEGPEIAPPSETVASYLLEHSEEIERLRELLGHGPEPVWEWNPAEMMNARIPSFQLVIYVERILADDALVVSRAGDGDRALADAEAGWRLAAALDRRPELIAKVVAVACKRIWAGVLRKAPDVQEEWIARLEKERPTDQIVEGLEADVVSMGQMIRHPAASDRQQGIQTSASRRLGYFLAKPWLTLSGADLGRSVADLVLAFRRLQPCTGDLASAQAKVRESISGWNVLGRIAFPNLTQVWLRAWRLRLDSELTAKVLRAKAARRENGGTWPTNIPGIEKCAGCPAGRFDYSVAEGTMTLVYRGKEPAKGEKYAHLPLSYREAAP